MVKLGLMPRCAEIKGLQFSSHFENYKSMEVLRVECSESFTNSTRFTICFLSSHSLTIQFSSVESFSRVWLFVIPWIAALQAPCPSPTPGAHPNSCASESVIPSSHLILCHPLFHLSPVPPSIRVFPNESALRMRWPKYWSFSFSISPNLLDINL